MKTRSSMGFVFVLAAVLGVSAGAWTLQQRQATGLRIKLEQAKAEAGELARLRAENQRLQEKQIPESELTRLRSDHAALPRLRAELEAIDQQTKAPGR